MHDNVAVIEEQPAGVGSPFAMVRQHSLFLQGFIDFLADGVYLPGAIASADNKIVRETAHLTDIQQNYITCLLIAGGFYGFAR